MSCYLGAVRVCRLHVCKCWLTVRVLRPGHSDNEGATQESSLNRVEKMWTIG